MEVWQALLSNVDGAWQAEAREVLQQAQARLAALKAEQKASEGGKGKAAASSASPVSARHRLTDAARPVTQGKAAAASSGAAASRPVRNADFIIISDSEDEQPAGEAAARSWTLGTAA